MRQKARSMDMPSLDYNNSDLELKDQTPTQGVDNRRK